MFTEQELHTIAIYDAEARNLGADTSPLDLDPFAVKTFQRMRLNGHVLDIGCGDGRVIPLLPDLGINKNNYIGIDPSIGQISLARSRYPDLVFEVGNIYELCDKYPNHFDGFWCCMMLMHIPHLRILDALTSLRKSLKQNAVGVIATACGVGVRHDNDGVEYNLYTVDELRALLECAGFRSSFYNPIPPVQVGSIVAI